MQDTYVSSLAFNQKPKPWDVLRNENMMLQARRSPHIVAEASLSISGVN